MPVVTDDQIISLHSVSGSTVAEYTPDKQVTSMWTRDLSEVSRAELTLPPVIDLDALPEIVPWLHWVSVWDGERNIKLWSGPVQRRAINRRGLTVSARDGGALLQRTRNPITKRWDAADPAWIAGELWRSMIEQNGLREPPIIREDPDGERFDYRVVKDDQMLDATISDLVNLGLRWSIVSGVPILGPLPHDPVATLTEADFIGDGIELLRDGSTTFNDILVRGPDNLARSHVDLHGLQLEAIVNVDSMFGLSNVERAAYEKARHNASIRDVISLPQGTQLSPDAPVSIDELMPSARFVIEAYGLRQLVELIGVEVTRDQTGGVATAVKMEAVPPKIELDDVKPGGSTSPLTGAAL
ncbi:minor tail protein [Mycobacterium phage Thonko]|uniref:Minor tail protein n=1 Tax=Mycobacterium phage Thonko TaxID=2282910 RepID=A0A346FC75_9CAUD|nr:minor tail protein [Mycobacterium phage Thonko]AXN53300.1 minor tail protein [Mycobacterium phage Thonko]